MCTNTRSRKLYGATLPENNKSSSPTLSSSRKYTPTDVQSV